MRAALPRRELRWLLAIVAVGLLVRAIALLTTLDVPLVGDEPWYDRSGRYAAEEGRWLWGDVPYGPHPSVWKMPLYPLWVGAWYSVLGVDPDGVRAVQVLLGAVTIVLTFLLGRRLFSPAVGLGAAAVVAVHPIAWLFELRVLSESLAVPLTLAFLLVVLDRDVLTVRRAALAGGLLALNLYARPSALMLAVLLAVAFVLTAGRRRGAALTAVSAGVVVLALVPWWARTIHLQGAWMPLSTQDAALYGTFNDEAAADRVRPYKWRPLTARDTPLLETPMSEHEFRARLRENALAYIREHPESVPEAFFWNGITRLWDLRRPAHVLTDAEVQGLSRPATAVGLGLYWLMLPLAVVALWRERRRRALVLPLLAVALAASVGYTADAGTRYRVPLEPVIAILACATIAAHRAARGGNSRSERPDRPLGAPRA